MKKYHWKNLPRDKNIYEHEVNWDTCSDSHKERLITINGIKTKTPIFIPLGIATWAVATAALVHYMPGTAETVVSLIFGWIIYPITWAVIIIFVKFFTNPIFKIIRDNKEKKIQDKKDFSDFIKNCRR